MRRDGLLILLDEFDVLRNKSGLGSLMKSLSSPEIKFGICGIGQDLTDLVEDHASVERLLEEGALHVQPMSFQESEDIISTAERLFGGLLLFHRIVIRRIARVSQGYPYFTQVIGKECVAQANRLGSNSVTPEVFDFVLEDIKSGRAFPTLESAYKRAIGNSKDRQLLLHLLAEQNDEHFAVSEELGRVALKKARKDAEELDIQYIDQLLPRLIDPKFGPALRRLPEGQGVYEFENPVLRLYIQLRTF